MSISLEKAKLISEICTAAVGTFAILVGGIFALVEYQDNKQSNRVRASLDFLETRNSQPLTDGWSRIRTAWRKHDFKHNEFLSRTKLDIREYFAFVNTVIDNEELDEAIVVVIGFFETLEVCSQELVCDEATSRAMFEREANSFYNLHYPFIERQRIKYGDPSYASGLKRFVRAEH
jgi:hypothetical protein